MTERAEQFRRLFLALRIEEQRDYYVERSTEYRAAHEQAVVVRNVLLLVAAVAGVVGPFVPPTARAALGVTSAVLGALAAAVTAFESLIGFAHLEKLYADAARNLEEAAIDWRTMDLDQDLTVDVERVENIFPGEPGPVGPADRQGRRGGGGARGGTAPAGAR